LTGRRAAEAVIRVLATTPIEGGLAPSASICMYVMF
jgi:hypothetical protein